MAPGLISPQLLRDLTVIGTSQFSPATPGRQFSALKISSTPKLALLKFFIQVGSRSNGKELSFLSLIPPTLSTKGWRTPCARHPITLQVLGLLDSVHFQQQ